VARAFAHGHLNTGEIMPDATPSKPGLARMLPFLVIVVVAVVGAITLRDQLSFDALARHRLDLLAYRDAHYLASVLVFMSVYIVIVGFSLPGATVASLTGGFLFGIFPGTLFNLVAATTGAVCIFLAARMGFGSALAARIESQGGKVARLRAALAENEWSVLFLMRLTPVVPFFVANLLPALLNIRLSRFVISTGFGIIPGALVLTSVGAGLGEVFERGGMPDLSIVFAPQVLLPILGLAVLAALPILIRLVRKKDI
jgi:uncharacterized membrane protein YdjX (TVP38/TMEM64 family)